MLALSTIQSPLQTGGRGEDSGCLVTVPNNSGAGLGEKETLCVYRPLLVRHKSSFFRSYHGKSDSFRKKLRQTLRRKVRRQETETRRESEGGGRESIILPRWARGQGPHWATRLR